MAASSAFFSITELRELVIDELPARSLFVAKRVNKDWRATTELPKFSKRMFLIADGKPKEPKEYPPGSHIVSKPDYMLTETRLNPLLSLSGAGAQTWATLTHSPGIPMALQHTHPHDSVKPGYLVQVIVGVPARTSAPAEQSWRSTFLTQPPITEVRFKVQFKRAELSVNPIVSRVAVYCKNPSGLTLGEIFDRWQWEFNNRHRDLEGSYNEEVEADLFVHHENERLRDSVEGCEAAERAGTSGHVCRCEQVLVEE